MGVRESGLELGAGWWGAVQAPLPATLAPAGGFCALPPPGPLLGGVVVQGNMSGLRLVWMG